MGNVRPMFKPEERWTTVYFTGSFDKADTFEFTLINEKRSELELGEIVFIGLVGNEAT